MKDAYYNIITLLFYLPEFYIIVYPPQMLINDAGIYYYQKSKKRKREKSPVVFLAILLFLAWITYVTYQRLTLKPTEVSGVTTSQLLSTISPTPKRQDENRLEYVVKEALSGTKGTYGIVILNLKTGEYYFQNETVIFAAASLYKLWVMATAFEQIKNGLLREADVLSQDMDVLRMKFNLATPSGEIDHGEEKDGENRITFTVGNALTQMITISDNNAALLLSEKLRLKNVSSFLGRQGFVSSRVGTGNEPTTSPLEVALFLKSLYEGKIVDNIYSKKMLDLLRWQKLNNKIPKYLPENLIIAHKTAELDEFNHDGGIVFAPNGDYIIVVMSKSDVSSRYLAEERIAVVSREVYKYFNGN